MFLICSFYSTSGGKAADGALFQLENACAFGIRLLLRTGLRLPDSAFAPVAAALEAKFNPYHDPNNGQFTFAPGGSGAISDGVFRPEIDRPKFVQTGGSGPPRGIGANGGPPLDPLVLEHAFPGLRDAPGGTIIAAAAPLADIMGPKERLTTELSLAYSGKLIDEIKALDPSYESEAFPSTFDGQMRHIDNLRWDRATAVYGKTGNAGPLQYETMCFLQKQVDAEYENALEAAGRGELPPAPTRAMAIGNYLDRAVQRALRNQLSNLRAAHRGALPAKVNAREYDTSGEDLTYTRPDARIGNLALDATLSRKTPGSRQIRGFFNSDFAPAAVAIIRPTYLGGSYIITRPGN